MKTNIVRLKKDIADAKARHAEATKDVKRIEKDMSDFNNNKDSKLAELESSLEKLRKSQMKNLTAVKLLQKDLQEARLEQEQAGSDLGAAQEQVEEAEAALKAQDEEMESLKKEQASLKVSWRNYELLINSNLLRMPMTKHKLSLRMNGQDSRASTTSFGPWKTPRNQKPNE